jgi:integration host factor subunit beta
MTTKSELIEKLTNKFSQLQQRDIDVSVRIILEAMITALNQGRRIEIRGFGSFTISHRPARIGRNPKSGQNVSIPAKAVPHFKAGKQLRQRVDYSL